MTQPPYSSRSRSNHKPLLFHGDYYQRLHYWRHLRDQLQVSVQPLQDLMHIYKQCPLTYTKTNFFDRNSWIQPWLQIQKNEYNEVDRLIHMWHTLKLTENFSEKSFELIQCEQNSKTFYIMCVENQFCVVENSTIYTKKEFDKNYISTYNHNKL